MTVLAVIGDAFLDVDIRGRSSRLCPDAPAPVIDVDGVRPRPGGADLAALLAARADTTVRLVTAIPADEAGRRLLAALERAGVQVVSLPSRGRTEVKQRVIVGTTVIARLDRGRTVVDDQDPSVPALVRSGIDGADALLVSDYGRGMTASGVIRAALTESAIALPLVWDPHPNGARPVAGTRMVTPSRQEARIWADRLGRRGAASAAPSSFRVDADDLRDAIEDAQVLASRWSVGVVALTVGARGVLLHVGDGAPLVIPPDRHVIADTCGAGDAFAGALALATARGTVISEAAALACRSAVAFLEAGGAAGALPQGMAQEETAVRTDDDAQQVIERVRAQGGRVVATGGCFDLLHAGHVEALTAARRLGDCLVVLLNSDRSVRRLKGGGRPMQPAADRRRVLEALAAVDAVVLFDGRTPEHALRTLRPDIWVKGGDYTGQPLVEESVLADWGGVAVTVPSLTGRSTTALAARMTDAAALEEAG